MVPRGVTTGRKPSLMPYSLKAMVTERRPAPGETRGNGNSPPATKRAAVLLITIRLGSANICSLRLASSAWIAAARLRSRRKRKRLTAWLREKGGPPVWLIGEPVPTAVVWLNAVLARSMPRSLLAERSTVANFTWSKIWGSTGGEGRRGAEREWGPAAGGTTRSAPLRRE